MKRNKTKQLRISADLFHVLSKVKLDNEKWSATARRYLDNYVKAVYPEVVEEIEKSYAMAADVLKDTIVKEIIQDAD